MPTPKRFYEMLFRKKAIATLQPFSRIMPSRWLAEYSGILPYCVGQKVSISHHLLCSKVDAKHKRLLLDAGIEIFETERPKYVVWCVCRLVKDHGEVRLLFRRYLDLPTVDGFNDPDWMAFKLTQHLHSKLLASKDFQYLVPCAAKREYPWCAEDRDFSDYWQMEINVKLKKL